MHAHDPHATAASLLAARLCRGPRLVASRRVSLPVRGPFSRRKYAACDRVIAVSQAVARGLLDDGLPARRLLRGPLEAEALRQGLGGRCVFTGFRADVDRLIPAFSLVCLTSRTEGLGSSLLDAMCFGRAVVATRTGGIPEAVVHGRTGVLVPVGDASALAAALTRLFLSPAEREAMGRAGRRRFERLFTADRMVDRTLRSYDSLRHA